MNEKQISFLNKLLSTPSPSGYEYKAVKVFKEEMQNYCSEVKIDTHGNAIARLNPENKPRIFLSGHIDELGFQIAYIDDNGFLYFNRIGGFDTQLIPGRKVRIMTENGEILGILGKKAIHLIEKKDQEKVPKPHELYIDIGVKNKESAQALVEIGDYATYFPNFEKVRDDIYTSHGFDDKIGTFIVANVMQNLYKEKNEFKSSLFSVATVQEELGMRGAITSAYGVNPDIGIAFDVTHSADTPDTDAKKDGNVKLGEGVVIVRGANINPVIFRMLVSICKEKDIPYQIEAIPGRTGTDANFIQLTRAGVPTGLIAIPLRYMHTNCEVIKMSDVECAISLLTEFCKKIDENIDFTPC